MRVPFIEQFGINDEIQYMARMFVNLERSCDNDAFATSVAERYFCTLNVPLSEAIINPLIVSERTPLCWRRSRPLLDPEALLKPSYCRLVVHYLEWIAAVEEFAALDEIRKVRLATVNAIPLILLTLSFNTFKYESVELLLCNGFFLPAKNIDGCCSTVELIANELEKKIVTQFRKLDVHEEEYVLLKLVLFFSQRAFFIS
ncbi:unnamed protein product [Nippostrongylus brasiliensis]|uniref:NR LBD domain-containing protein n=1 Tax=Nippostrongylus brasiliensis TaxID=27835 RepID=A0A0N4YHF6_NIPBR|nr:unnamed protein product [Nippostrongylus brasiliensis]